MGRVRRFVRRGKSMRRAEVKCRRRCLARTRTGRARSIGGVLPREHSSHSEWPSAPRTCAYASGFPARRGDGYAEVGWFPNLLTNPTTRGFRPIAGSSWRFRIDFPDGAGWQTLQHVHHIWKRVAGTRRIGQGNRTVLPQASSRDADAPSFGLDAPRQQVRKPWSANGSYRDTATPTPRVVGP